MNKPLKVESWSTQNVCDWFRGLRVCNESLIDFLIEKQVDGKYLCLLQLADLNELFPTSTLADRLLIHKSVQCLLQFKHDIGRDTMHKLMFTTCNRIQLLIRYAELISSCHTFECEQCIKWRHELVSNANSLTPIYRRLLMWLVKLPFTKLKQFELFRNEINSKMKAFLKMFRKKSLTENMLNEMRQTLYDIVECFRKMLEYCDKHCEEESGRMSLIYNHAYLDRVVLKSQRAEQPLGLSFISLIDGIFTIGEIERESAADDCSRLNVEDDLVAINDQVIVAWDVDCVKDLLADMYAQNSHVHLLLRKMPKESISTLKHYQQKTVLLYNANKRQNSSIKSQNQRKHSFTDIFLADDYLIDESTSNEEEEDDVENDEDDDDDNENNNNTSMHVNNSFTDRLRNKIKLSSRRKKLSNDSLYQNTKITDLSNNHGVCTTKLSTGGNKSTRNKLAKLAQKTNRNRLIRSMQNLFYERSRSRSNSRDKLGSSADEDKTKTLDEKSKKKTTNEDENDSATQTSKSDIIKSIFSFDACNLFQKSKSRDKKDDSSCDLPNLLQNSPPPLSTSTNGQEWNSQTVSRKPPLNKRAYKMSNNKPILQGWLYKRKHAMSTSTSSINSTSTNNSLIKHNHHHHSKWRRYWFVLMKDYIIYYKHPDDKTPKDFFLVKDFSVSQSANHKNGFVLTDKIKQVENEFYAETNEDCREWCNCLNDMRTKLQNDLVCSSLSSAISSTSTDILNSSTNKERDDSVLTASSVPSNVYMGRKMNSPTSPSSIQQQHCQNSFSSRETSPAFSSKPSRDSSPCLNYPYQQEQDTCAFTTSDSDAESVTSRVKEKVSKLIKPKNSNSSKISSIATQSASASAGLLVQSSCSPSPVLNSSSNQFTYDNDNEEETQESAQHRCNSLPGSLQACVGSYMKSIRQEGPNKSDQSASNQITHGQNIPHSSTYLNQPKQPIQIAPASAQSSSNTYSQAIQTNLNQDALKLISSSPSSVSLLQNAHKFNSNSPTYVVMSKTTIPASPSTTSAINYDNNNNFIEPNQSQSTHVQGQPSNTRRISFQLGPFGIKSHSQAVSSSSQLSTQVPMVMTTVSPLGTNLKRIQTPPNPILYRTELTIMPTQSNKTAKNSNVASISQQERVANNNDNSTLSNYKCLPTNEKRIYKF